MDIVFRKEKQRKIFNDKSLLLAKYGMAQAEKIRSRLDDVDAAACLEVLRNAPGHWHELSGDRADQIAVSLREPYRLIFEPAHDPIPRDSMGRIDWGQVTALRVLEVVDYHD